MKSTMSFVAALWAAAACADPAALGLQTDWLPASEVKGEGIFVRLDEEALHAWEKSDYAQQWETPAERAALRAKGLIP